MNSRTNRPLLTRALSASAIVALALHLNFARAADEPAVAPPATAPAAASPKADTAAPSVRMTASSASSRSASASPSSSTCRARQRTFWSAIPRSPTP
jgi:hypothetical protein